MYYVKEVSTGRIIYVSRLGVRAIRFLHKLKPGTSYFLDSDMGRRLVRFEK